MLRLGLTGGIAGGKSTALRLLAELGARVFDADLLARELMNPGGAAHEAVVARFGREILAPGGEIDRPKLAAIVFPGRTAELNAIVHPLVLGEASRHMRDVAADEPQAVCVVEAALLLEAGGRGVVDKLLVVVCPDEEARLSRYMTRAGLPREEARVDLQRRLAAQMPEKDKAALADFVIDNSGSPSELKAKIVELWPRLQHLA